MKYGLTFIMDLYDFEKEQELHVLTTPGDYIRMCKWADEHLTDPQPSGDVKDLRRNYATTWHALKRRGKLDELGLPGELDVDAVDAMADRFSIYVNSMEDGSLPLARERSK